MSNFKIIDREMETKIRWFFIEYASQRNVDELTKFDMEKAIKGCHYIVFGVYAQDDVFRIWNSALQDVAQP